MVAGTMSHILADKSSEEYSYMFADGWMDGIAIGERSTTEHIPFAMSTEMLNP